jgi:hypothetical protein
MDTQSNASQIMPYLYSKLPSPTHTRLLELLPSEVETDELQCKIHIVDLHHQNITLYEAVSYTWGSNILSHTLWVFGGPSSPDQLLITANLSDALRKFRRPSQPRMLWVDAASINQKDNEEKSTHIPLMVDIYRGASRVLVWLGNGPEEHMLPRINALGRLLHIQSGGLSDSQLQELKESMMGIIILPWFSRRWIIQEVVMNLDVVIFCGSQRSSFLRIVQILNYLSLREPGQASSRQARSLLAMFELWKRCALKQDNQMTCGILSLLQDFDHFDCADGRDRIFTLATLAEDIRVHTHHPDAQEPQPHLVGWHQEIVVHYGSSVEDVYTSTAEMLLQSNSLEWVLREAAKRSCAVRPAGLPSWVPDWQNSVQRSSFWGSDRKAPLLGRSESQEYSIRRLANSNAILLNAELSYIKNWRPSVPECYVDRLEAYNDVAGSGKWVLNVDSSLDKNALAPMAITWKGECSPDMETSRDVLNWMKSSFSTIWERVLSSLGEVNSNQEFAVRKSRAWNQCVDRFSYVITAGGRFFSLLDYRQRESLVELCRCSKTDLDRSDGYVPKGGEDGELEEIACPFTEHLSKDRIQEIRQTFPNDPILVGLTVSNTARDVILGTAEDSPGLDALFALISITMKGRCLFTCEVDWKPAHALPADIMGIGVPYLKEGDRILSTPFKNDFVEKKRKAIWDKTMVVREAALDPNIAGEITAEQLRNARQPFPPPVYEFIGDCFLTTTRWLSVSRGFQRQRWKVQEFYEFIGPNQREQISVGVFDNRNSDRKDFDIILI